MNCPQPYLDNGDVVYVVDPHGHHRNDQLYIVTADPYEITEDDHDPDPERAKLYVGVSGKWKKDGRVVGVYRGNCYRIGRYLD